MITENREDIKFTQSDDDNEFAKAIFQQMEGKDKDFEKEYAKNQEFIKEITSKNKEKKSASDFFEKAFEVGVNLYDKFMDYAEKEADKIDKHREHILRLAQGMESKSDDELKRIYQTSSGDSKMAAVYLLKQRGY